MTPSRRRTAVWAALALAGLGAAGCARHAGGDPAADEPGGALEFRILANRRHDAPAVDRALAPGGLEHPPEGYRWARLGEVVAGTDPRSTADTVTDPTQSWVKNRYAGAAVELSDGSAGPKTRRLVRSNTADTLVLARPHGLAAVSAYRLDWNPSDVAAADNAVVREHPTANGVVERFLLVKLDPSNVSNRHVARAAVTTDERNRPAVSLTFTPEGAEKFGRLTREHLPEDRGDFRYQLAILVDNLVLSAPNLNSEIRSAAIIEGGQSGFTGTQADWLARVLVQLVTLDPGAEALPASPLGAFQDARFGLGVHWGVDALLGRGEWVMERDALPVSEYEKLPPNFRPEGFDARSWVKAAESAGAKYLAVNAKHHDGFCMFDSALTRYDVVDATPHAADPLKDLADACRERRLPLFVSYSLLDWHHPDYAPRGRTGRTPGRDGQGDWSAYVAYYQGQVRELCTNYGPLGGVRLEGLWDKPGADWGLDATVAMIHALQPGAVVLTDGPGGDARVVDAGRPVGPDDARPREVCRALNGARGYRADAPPDAPSGELVRLLAESAGRGANLLLFVAATPDGAIPAGAAGRLAEVGRWLDAHGPSVYGTRPGPLPPQPWGVSTRAAGDDRPGAVFLHVLKPAGALRLPGVSTPFDARVLDGARPLALRREGSGSVLELPEADRPEADSVIVLTPKAPAR